MAVLDRFQGRRTQFHIELVYGLLFIGGFALLTVRLDARIAAFEAGLVVGYLLHVWEKMAIYERVLEDAISEAAEDQVAEEVEATVGDEVESELAAQVPDEVEAELEDQVAEEVEAELADLDDQIDEAVEERVGEE